MLPQPEDFVGIPLPLHVLQRINQVYAGEVNAEAIGPGLDVVDVAQHREPGSVTQPDAVSCREHSIIVTLRQDNVLGLGLGLCHQLPLEHNRGDLIWPGSDEPVSQLVDSHVLGKSSQC